jgi:hypothetical protein
MCVVARTIPNPGREYAIYPEGGGRAEIIPELPRLLSGVGKLEDRFG